MSTTPDLLALDALHQFLLLFMADEERESCKCNQCEAVRDGRKAISALEAAKVQPKEKWLLGSIQVHMTHCFQGEYLHTCKYGQDEVCPAKPAAQPVVPQPPKLPFSYSAGTCRSFGEGTAKVSLYFDDIKEAEPWFDSLTVAPAPLVVEPVAKIVRNEAGQIRICDANGDSFDMSKYVGASFYTNPAPAGLPAWQPIETAPKDGTEIEIMVLHKNYQFCETDKQRAEWQQIVLAKWIDFNGGGWTWSGMAGSPWGWRPRSAAIAAQGERHETL